MNESKDIDNGQNYDIYVEEDINEMIEKLASYPDSPSGSTENIHRVFSHKHSSDGVEQVSVVELNPISDETNIPFYYLFQRLVTLVETISADNKKQIKKINKLHHDLASINADLISMDKNLHISNLIKLYENKIISKKELMNFIMKEDEINEENNN